MNECSINAQKNQRNYIQLAVIAYISEEEKKNPILLICIMNFQDQWGKENAYYLDAEVAIRLKNIVIADIMRFVKSMKYIYKINKL